MSMSNSDKRSLSDRFQVIRPM